MDYAYVDDWNRIRSMKLVLPKNDYDNNTNKIVILSKFTFVIFSPCEGSHHTCPLTVRLSVNIYQINGCRYRRPNQCY